MIDLHSHILPGIDDGPEHLEGSVALARAAAQEGIETLAATPHVNSRFQLGAGDLERLPGLLDEVNAELARQGLVLEVVKGAEISLSRLGGLQQSELEALCLGHGDCLLVESPYATVVPLIEEMLFSVQAKGFRPVLAHPERCPAFQKQPARVARLVEMGAFCLVNAGSVAGSFGRGPRRASLELLREGLVHAVSSDAHDHQHRPPRLLGGLAAAEEELPGVLAEIPRLTSDAPAAILAGQPVPAPPKLEPRRRGRLRRLLARRS